VFSASFEEKITPKKINGPILSATLYVDLKPCFAHVNELK